MKKDKSPPTKKYNIVWRSHYIVKCAVARKVYYWSKNRVVVINFVVCNREEGCIFTNKDHTNERLTKSAHHMYKN